MMDWKRTAIELWRKGESWNDITAAVMPIFEGKRFPQVRETVRGYIRKTAEYKQKNKPTENLMPSTRKFSMLPNGDAVSERFILLKESENLTSERLLELHGLSPNNWCVYTCTNNFWNTQKKGGELEICYQSKLTAKPNKTGFSFAHLDEYFATKKFSDGEISIIRSAPCSDGEILEICLPDLHSGLYAAASETGETYDKETARARLFAAMGNILVKCTTHRIKKIYFVTLGDLLHFDTDDQKTTKGTFQQADGRLTDIFDFTLESIITCIANIAAIAPTEVIYIPGNHDRIAGYALIKAAEKAFSGNEVIFDTAPNSQKYRLIGKTLVGYTHGDMPKKNIANWLPNTAREEYGRSRYCEVHAGHTHSDNVYEYKTVDSDTGIIVRYLPRICASSEWEHRQGYPSSAKAIMSYLYNEEQGMSEAWFGSI